MDVWRIEEEVDPDFLSDAHSRTGPAESDYLLPVIISARLEAHEKKRLVSVLKIHKEAFAWKTSPSFCKHNINFQDNAKPIIQRQRRLNPNMKEVVKKEIIKLLDAGIIYPIEDSYNTLCFQVIDDVDKSVMYLLYCTHLL
ncbi:hypothetical protein Tco_1097282 [Tanacetum coccineum]